MSGFFQNILKDVGRGFFGNEFIRDYQHAAKTFRPDAYALSPKLKFLFHVYFNINPAANIPGLENTNFGLVVKNIKLPGFTIAVSTLNQYNRKRIVQTKQTYQPIDISFHDDNSNMVTKLWQTYWTYYYGDGRVKTNPNQQTAVGVGEKNQYQNITNSLDGWGYIGEGNNNNAKPAFFDSIIIYGFHQKNFIKYTLVNPLITDFRHDTYDYSVNGSMMNTMGIEYETMFYENGAMDGTKPGSKVYGFGADANYDRTPSPLIRPGSNASILGQNGLVDAAGGFSKALTEGNLLGAARIAGTTYNTFKNKDLKALAKSEVKSGAGAALAVGIGAGVIAGARSVSWNTPAYGSTGQKSGTAGKPNPQLRPPPEAVEANAGQPAGGGI